MTKLDKRRKYYLVLDCETATMPFASEYDGKAKQKIAIAKPLIYDLGWQIIDIKGNVYKREKFLISEIFSVPSVFNTAYYASKRPIYLEKLKNGDITLTDWKNAVSILEEDLKAVQAVGAYNSMFDFKKAIPFTELYIDMLYSPDYYKWEKSQHEICDSIANEKTFESKKTFEPSIFRFRGNTYNLFDLWGLSCQHLINNDEYKKVCVENEWTTASGKYFKTSAETTFRYVMGQHDFDESHTAFEDAEIESQIFAKIGKITKHNFDMGIIYFPFRILGTVENFMMSEGEDL